MALNGHRSPPRPPATLPPGECHVWWARIDAAARARAQPLLDADEVERADRFRRREDGARFAIGRALTRLVLARYVGASPAELEIDRTCARCGRPHGRPRLVRPPAAVDVSISHAGRRAVVAVAAGARVGVDVEALDPDVAVDEIARAALTAGEVAAVRSYPDRPQRARALLVLWTRKEAVLKALGTGLARAPIEIAVSGPGESPAVLAGAPGASLHDVGPGDGYVASLAVLGAPAPGRVLEYDAAQLFAEAERGL